MCPKHARAPNAANSCFGTIDTWLLWKLTGGRSFATDATNASRTLLFDLQTQQWDDALCALFDVPRAVLPEVRDSNADFGHIDAACWAQPCRFAACLATSRPRWLARPASRPA